MFFLTHPFWLVHPVRWVWTALASALFLLAAAHAFETFGHMPPCELCLKQRELYWAAAAAGVAILVAARLFPAWPVARIGCGLLALIFFGEMGIAAYHAGVEWKFWPGPAACTGGPHVHVTLADLQVELFKSDARESKERLKTPFAVFAASVLLLWATIPVCLTTIV